MRKACLLIESRIGFDDPIVTLLNSGTRPNFNDAKAAFDRGEQGAITCLAACLCLFGLTPILNVENGSDIAKEAAVRTEPRRCGVNRPVIGSVTRAKAILQAKGGAIGVRFQKDAFRICPVIGMRRVKPPIALRLSLRLARKLVLAAVEKDATTVGIGDPHHDRRLVGNLEKCLINGDGMLIGAISLNLSGERPSRFIVVHVGQLLIHSFGLAISSV